MINSLEQKAWGEGERAFLAGKKEKDNPYPFGKGTWHLRAAWFSGFKSAHTLEDTTVIFGLWSEK